MNIALQAQEFLCICGRCIVNLMTELFQFISIFSTSSVSVKCCVVLGMMGSRQSSQLPLRSCGSQWPCSYWLAHHVHLHQLAEWETCNECSCRNQVQVLWLPEEDSHLKTWDVTKFNADELKHRVAKKCSTPNDYEINNYIPSHDPLGIW